MLRFIKFCNYIVVKLFELILRPFGVRQRVVFVSYFSETPNGNLKCMMDYIESKSDVDTVHLFASYGKGAKAKLRFIGHTLRETFYYCTSSLILLEGNSYVLSVIKKKKGVTAIQVWHAAGAFKKFGADVDRLYKISGLDCALVSSPCVEDIYAHALNVPRENVRAVGIPRADVFTDDGFLKAAREKLDEAHPEVRGKRTVLYAPTFRGKGIDDINAKDVGITDICGLLPDCALLVRKHPLMEPLKNADKYVSLDDADLMEALAAADILITDYSSIIFEYSLLDRPMIFLAPDAGAYEDERGFYFGYEGFVPGRLCINVEEAAAAIEKGDFAPEKRAEFRDKFTYGFDGTATERAAKMAFDIARMRF